MKKRFLLAALIIGEAVSAQESGCLIFKENQLKQGATSVNSETSDFGPAFIGKELWFSSMQPETNASATQACYQLFKAETDNSGEIISAKEKAEFTINGKNVGPVSYCEKTGELFITVNNTEHPDVQNNVFRKRTINLRIDIAEKVDGKWEITGTLPFNNPSVSIGHPSVSSTGDTLFFASNQPGTGFGGADIYMSVRVKGEWQPPVNLGEKVNTPGNEMFPFYMPGVLIYASDGLENGLGGLDICYSCISSSLFAKPVNPGAEINSAYDDFGLIIHPGQKIGYFVSNRPGQQGDDDIYRLELVSQETAGLVAEETSGRPVRDARVELLDCNGVKIAEVKTGKTGQFSFKTRQAGCYKIRVVKDMFSPLVLNVSGGANVIAKLKKDIDISQMIAGFLPPGNNDAGKAAEKDKPKETPKPAPDNETYFSVQVGACVPYIEINDPYFKGENISEVRKIGNFNKYFTGRFNDYNSAKKEALRLLDKKVDCFVVAFKNGEIVPVAEVLKSKKGK